MNLPEIKIEDLLEAGVHFGHNVRRWNPKMEEYIFGVRNNIHIFDLRIIKGQVMGGSLVNQIPYDDLPELNIDSETGVGAILRPVMSKRRPQGKIVQVIDCVS